MLKLQLPHFGHSTPVASCSGVRSLQNSHPQISLSHRTARTLQTWLWATKHQVTESDVIFTLISRYTSNPDQETNIRIEGKSLNNYATTVAAMSISDFDKTTATTLCPAITASVGIRRALATLWLRQALRSLDCLRSVLTTVGD